MKDDPAFPTESYDSLKKIGYLSGGLTKREYFAAMAMQGFCAGAYSENWNDEECAKHALICADALIAELEKK